MESKSPRDEQPQLKIYIGEDEPEVQSLPETPRVADTEVEEYWKGRNRAMRRSARVAA